MGLKVLRWVYDLGVKQERTRVASLLKDQITNRQFEIETRLNMYDDSQHKMGKIRLEKLKKSIELQQEVVMLIDALFDVKQTESKYTSLMFPEEEK